MIRLLALLAVLAGLAGPAAAQVTEVSQATEAAHVNVRLAMEYMKQGQLTVARQKIEKALEQSPRDVTVQLGAGLVYERLLEPQRAEKHFRQALRADARSPEAQNALGAFMCRNGDLKRGQQMFLDAARNPLYRTPEVAYTNAGVCARAANEPERAEQYLRQALAVAPAYTEALIQLAGVARDRGNLLQARAFLQRYLAAAPASAESLLLAHQVELGLGDKAAAAEFAERLRKQFPGSPQIRGLDRPPGDERG